MVLKQPAGLVQTSKKEPFGHEISVVEKETPISKAQSCTNTCYFWNKVFG